MGRSQEYVVDYIAGHYSNGLWRISDFLNPHQISWDLNWTSKYCIFCIWITESHQLSVKLDRDCRTYSLIVSCNCQTAVQMIGGKLKLESDKLHASNSCKLNHGSFSHASYGRQSSPKCHRVFCRVVQVVSVLNTIFQYVDKEFFCRKQWA